jgi:hypothetical protein
MEMLKNVSLFNRRHYNDRHHALLLLYFHKIRQLRRHGGTTDFFRGVVPVNGLSVRLVVKPDTGPDINAVSMRGVHDFCFSAEQNKYGQADILVFIVVWNQLFPLLFDVIANCDHIRFFV